MKKFRLYILSVISLFLTIPWFFFETESLAIAGIPVWAFYSLVVSFLYACIIYILLKKYWDISAEDSYEENK